MREVQFETSHGLLAGTLYPGPGPAVVLVAGSGPADRQSLQHWVVAAVDVGLTVLVYDKPGCGGSSGDWRHQDFEGRATETRAAVSMLRRQPEASNESIALIGGSQGAWIAMLAARDGDVDAVVCVSAAGVTVAEQELYRIEHQLPSLGFDTADVEAAHDFLARRISRLAAGESSDQIFADEEESALHRWRSAVGPTDRDSFDFDARIYGFDPLPIIRTLPSPVLAVWGANDVLVPVPVSLGALAGALPTPPSTSALIVIPHADHGLQVAEQNGDRRFPTNLWPMVSTWLRDAGARGPGEDVP